MAPKATAFHRDARLSRLLRDILWPAKDPCPGAGASLPPAARKQGGANRINAKAKEKPQ